MYKKELEKRQVCILGCSFNTGNMGVSALAASLVKLFSKIIKQIKIYFMVGAIRPETHPVYIGDNRRVNVEIVNFRLSPKSRPHEHLFFIFLLSVLYNFIPFKRIKRYILKKNKFLSIMNKADYICQIHGGDSFSDIYGLYRFFLYIIPNIIVFLLNKELIMLPQTYGPFNNIIVKMIVRYILDKSKIILSRDTEGLLLLKELLKEKYNKEKIRFCPDVAFTLDSVRPGIISIYPKIEDYKAIKIIGLNINGLMYNGGYNRRNMFKLLIDYKSLIHELVMSILENTNAHILFIPHTYGRKDKLNSDPDACTDVFNSLRKNSDRLHLVVREYDQNEIKGIIGLCDFFIGSRMHSCIAALSQEIPTIGIAYSKKFLGIFNSINKSDMVIDCRYLKKEVIIEKVFSYYNNYEILVPEIKKDVDNIKNVIEKTFFQILNLH